jgi:hypothetical protein
MRVEKRAEQQCVIEGQRQPTEDEIRERAYEIYCARNGSLGEELSDGLKAAAELKVEGPTSK